MFPDFSLSTYQPATFEVGERRNDREHSKDGNKETVRSLKKKNEVGHCFEQMHRIDENTDK